MKLSEKDVLVSLGERYNVIEVESGRVITTSLQLKQGTEIFSFTSFTNPSSTQPIFMYSTPSDLIFGEIKSLGRLQMTSTSFPNRGVRKTLYDQDHNIYLSLLYNFSNLSLKFTSYLVLSDHLNCQLIDKHLHEFEFKDSYITHDICYVQPFYYVSALNLDNKNYYYSNSVLYTFELRQFGKNGVKSIEKFSEDIEGNISGIIPIEF